MTEIEPCPNPVCQCKDVQVISGGPGCHYVKCRGCGLQTDDGRRDRQVALWNSLPRTHTAPSGEVERVARAIEDAQCKGREGPFGGYDYGHNTAFYGRAPEGGRYVIRDFRDFASPDWGKWLHQTNDSEEHERMFAKMTREHIAQAAIAAMLPASGELADELDYALRSALRFAASRSAITAAEEKAILAALRQAGEG